MARDHRTGPRTALAGHAAGASLLGLASAEEVDPAVVRRTLRAAGIAVDALGLPRERAYELLRGRTLSFVRRECAEA